MRTADVFKKIQGCPVGKAFSFKHNKCIDKNKLVCNIDKSEVVKRKPKRSIIDWKCDDTILGNAYDLWKGTVNDFYNSEMNFMFKYTNQPVELHFTIGGDVIYERKNPGLMGDYRSPPWCIPTTDACYNRERLYEIAEEIYGIPIIDHKNKRLNESLFGKKVNLKAWTSINPGTFAALRIQGNDGVFYLLAPQHVWGGPLRENMLYNLAHTSRNKKQKIPRIGFGLEEAY